MDQIDTDQLDLSWTEEHIRTTKSQTMYNKEPMSKINIQFVYINTNNEVSKIVKEEHDLTLIDNASSMLSEQIIFKLTKSKGILTETSWSNGILPGTSRSNEILTETSRSNGILPATSRSNGQSTRYHLDDILLYCISLDPAKMSDYVASPNRSNSDPFMKIIPPICGNIIVPASLFIFHPLNTIYFIFREMVLVQDTTHKPAIKPVLKSAMSKNGLVVSKKMTKRVRISSNLPSYKNLGHDHNKTAKIRIIG